MVFAVAAATGGQGCVVSIEGGRERAQAEEQDEQNGESAAHLAFIVHELWIVSRFGEGAAFRYHRSISNSRSLIERLHAVSREDFCLGKRSLARCVE
jgi:hypothetical protein